MSDNVRGEFEALRGIWPTVSDTDKIGVVEQLAGLLRHADAADASGRLADDIRATIDAVKDSQYRAR